MKRFFLTACLLALVAVQAVADDFDRIIDIKLHSEEYLWAQARVPVKDDAINMAREMLVDEINGWIKENSSELTATRLLDACEVICVKKGGLYLALAYLKKDDIANLPPEPVKEPEKEPEKEPVQEDIPAETAYDADKAVSLILTTQKMDVLKEMLEQDALMKEVCTWGDIDASTKPGDINNSYLVIYNPESLEIVSVLSPRQPKRVNLFTGMNDSTANYPGHKACWITVKD